MKEEFNCDDFNWDMVQSENKFFARHMAGNSQIEFNFLDGEILTGTIKWYDEMNIGIYNDKKEEIYMDKRAIKWLKLLSVEEPET